LSNIAIANNQDADRVIGEQRSVLLQPALDFVRSHCDNNVVDLAHELGSRALASESARSVAERNGEKTPITGLPARLFGMNRAQVSASHSDARANATVRR
jgi:hypothetical protein